MYSFLLLSLIFVLNIQAQNEASAVQIDTLAVSDILEEGEKINLRIIELKETLKPSATSTRLDSILDNEKVKIFGERDSLLSHIDNVTRRVLRVHQVKWLNYRTSLKGYQNQINERNDEINNINNELAIELQKWNKIRKSIIDNEETSSNHDRLDAMIRELEEITIVAETRLGFIESIRKELIELILTVDETVYKIKEVELQIKKNYFVFDSNPIWKSPNIDIKESNKTKIDSLSTLKLISLKLKENKGQLKQFLSANIKTVFLQLLFILLLFVLILRMKGKWKNDMIALTNPIENEAKIILSHPFSTTIVIGLITSYFFYQAVIPTFAELTIFFILISTIILLPKLTNKRFGLFLLLIFSAYLIFILETYLTSKLALARVLAIIQALILIIALVKGRQIIRQFPEQFKTVYKLFNLISRVYVFILIVAILANFIGMTNLSRFLIKGILASTILGMVVFLAVKSIISLVVMSLKLQRSYNIKTISNIISDTHKRILTILNWLGIVIWMFFTLKGFDVFDLLVSWVDELMLVQWKIGEAMISLGGILSFVSIFIVTLILAKLTTTFFKDEWIVNVFPRGVASAISLMLKIILISIGFSIVLLVAGFDLSKLGFIVGALGVGIGFGLQNVVLNFIVGLILAFERFINVGDVIEVDQEMGVVIDIGVRVSIIKLYIGYDVIVSNGDLITKKLINYTLSNNDRRSKILMKTVLNVDFEPNTFFYGYGEEGNLNFVLIYWSTFSDTLNLDHEISLGIFKSLKKEGIEAPTTQIKIIKGD